jgi:hypothetical protein
MSDDDPETMSEDDTREQGIEFGEFEGTMEEIDYPIDHEELVEQHGDAELELPDGETTLEEILAPLEDDQQTYQDADELETMIMNMVGDDAVGREGYSDRGDEEQMAEDDEQEAF